MINYIWATEDTLKRYSEDGTHSFVSKEDSDYLEWSSSGNTSAIAISFSITSFASVEVASTTDSIVIGSGSATRASRT